MYVVRAEDHGIPGFTYRSRIARELLAESLVIGLAGALLGLLLASGGLHVLVAMGPGDLPRLDEIAVHPQVLAFTVAVSLASTLLFGSITALKQSLHAEAPMSGAASRGRPRSSVLIPVVIVPALMAGLPDNKAMVAVAPPGVVLASADETGPGGWS